MRPFRRPNRSRDQDPARDVSVVRVLAMRLDLSADPSTSRGRNPFRAVSGRRHGSYRQELITHGRTSWTCTFPTPTIRQSSCQPRNERSRNRNIEPKDILCLAS